MRGLYLCSHKDIHLLHAIRRIKRRTHRILLRYATKSELCCLQMHTQCVRYRPNNFDDHPSAVHRYFRGACFTTYNFQTIDRENFACEEKKHNKIGPPYSTNTILNCMGFEYGSVQKLIYQSSRGCAECTCQYDTSSLSAQKSSLQDSQYL